MNLNFFRLSDERKVVVVEEALEQSEANFEYYLMLVLSILMATIGLFLNEATVIIGSMLIAPVISPAISLSMGFVLSDFKIIKLSGKTLLISMGVAFATAALISLFIDPVLYPLNNEILSRTDPSMLYFLVAFIAGIGASVARVKEKLSSTLIGVAISTALVPPLAVVGIGIARFDWQIMSKSLLLFLANVAGIVLAALLVFSLFNLQKKK